MQENELVARPEISKLSELETTVGHRNLPTRVFAGQLNQLLKGLWSGAIFLPYVSHHNVESLKRMCLLKEIINPSVRDSPDVSEPLLRYEILHIVETEGFGVC